MDFSNDKIIKARAQHKCVWCGETIEPGDTYVRWACFDDGVCVVRIHPECRAAWQELQKRDPDYCELPDERFGRGSVEKRARR